MKSFLYVIALCLLGVLSACDNSIEPEEQLEIDKGIIADYVASNNIQGEFTDSGLFIAIADTGSGTEFPVITSVVEIIYTGTLLDGTQFDSSDGFPVKFPIFNLIQGWQEGLQHFRRDGNGILLIPSRLGYGPQGTGTIPGNAVLRFDIELLDFE